MAHVTGAEPQFTFILGGARSGKSAYAMALARRGNAPTLYVATATPSDAEMRAKIRRHRADRPKRWTTIEEPIDLAERLAARAKPGAIAIIDCLTVWMGNLLERHVADFNAPKAAEIARAQRQARTELRRLCALPRGGQLRLIVVSNEVGSGIVPDNPISRAYRELLGEANQYLAQRADRVVLMVAGLPVEVK